MRYDLLVTLGRGGAGVVWMARDNLTGDTVAVKVLNPTSASIDELLIARKITHPNVCRVYELHQEGNACYLTMEMVEGESLRELENRTGRLEPDLMMNIAHQILDGLEAAHRCGIVHRDLKPGNIMISAEGVVKIMDFGLARYFEPDISQASQIAGTPSYMAPEQARGAAADFRSDIYSLGLILYEMANGCLPFSGGAIEVVIHKHLYDSPKPFRPETTVPSHIQRTILRCLEKEPSRRFASVAELREALSGVVGVGDESTVAGGSHVLPEPRRSRIPAVALLAVAAVLMVISWFAFREAVVPVSQEPARAAADLPSVLLFPMTLPQNDPKLGPIQSAVNTAFRQAIVDSSRFRLVSRPADAALNEIHNSQADAVAEKDRIRFGQLVGARYLVFGDLTVFPNYINMSARFVTTETGVIKVEKAVEGDPKDATQLANKLASLLMNEMKP